VDISDADLLAALKLQLDWGVDETLSDTPIDRRVRAPAQAEAPAPAQEQAVAASIPRAATPPPAVMSGTAADRARAVAAEARTVAELQAALAAFDGCALRDTAAHTVFAEGDPSTGTLLIGDVAGADEDRGGRVFAGADGAFLDRMLASIGLDRTRVHCAMLVPWRPPGGRVPSEREIATCLPFLCRYIALTKPARILLLGALSARALLGRPDRRRDAVAWREATVDGMAAPVRALAIETPARIMQSANAKRAAWAALRLLRRDLPTHT
jgi:DNA polymerase